MKGIKLFLLLQPSWIEVIKTCPLEAWMWGPHPYIYMQHVQLHLTSELHSRVLIDEFWGNIFLVQCFLCNLK